MVFADVWYTFQSPHVSGVRRLELLHVRSGLLTEPNIMCTILQSWTPFHNIDAQHPLVTWVCDFLPSFSFRLLRNSFLVWGLDGWPSYFSVQSRDEATSVREDLWSKEVRKECWSVPKVDMNTYTVRKYDRRRMVGMVTFGPKFSNQTKRYSFHVF